MLGCLCSDLCDLRLAQDCLKTDFHLTCLRSVGVKLAHSGRGFNAPHVRLTPLERDGMPIIAMDFAVRKV